MVGARATLVLALFAAVFGPASTAMAEESVELPVTINVEPYAEIVFPGTPVELTLTIPPPSSTGPSRQGVSFEARGNSEAEVTASPDDWLYVGPLEQYLGKAVKDGEGDEAEELGYDLEVRIGSVGHSLTGNYGEGTEPMSIDLREGLKEGEVHLIANHEDTEDGTWPTPGRYTATVSLTVTASP